MTLSNHMHHLLAQLADKYEINHDLVNLLAEGKLPISDIVYIIESRQLSDQDAKLLRRIAVAA